MNISNQEFQTNLEAGVTDILQHNNNLLADANCYQVLQKMYFMNLDVVIAEIQLLYSGNGQTVESAVRYVVF
jgi:hypothetical protein